MSEPSTQGLQVDRSLDVRGIPVPDDYRKIQQTFQEMMDSQVLELYLDDGEPLRRIPFGLRAEGHEILVSEPANNGVRLLIRKRPPLG